jgi:diguanylate cyclase (GGDEF)-like protein
LASLLRDVVAEQSVEDVLMRVLAALRELVRCNDVVVWQATPQETLVVAAVDGEDEAAFRSLEISLGEGLTGKAALERQPVSSANAHIDPAAGYVPGTAESPEGIVCVPLLARERLLGVLTLYRSGEERAFEAGEVELVSDFAAVAALALDNARTRSELERLARTDDLTGLLNRRAFMSQLEHELAVASRYASPLALLLLDLDNFKGINDSHGHGTGDRALQLVAETLSRCVRTPDTVARLGGDEFAVLLPQTLQLEAHALAGRLRVAIATLPLVQPLRASIGVATLEGNEQDALLEEADRLLYQAKRAQGRLGSEAERVSR